MTAVVIVKTKSLTLQEDRFPNLKHCANCISEHGVAIRTELLLLSLMIKPKVDFE
jgi:hypothetical protein